MSSFSVKGLPQCRQRLRLKTATIRKIPAPAKKIRIILHVELPLSEVLPSASLVDCSSKPSLSSVSTLLRAWLVTSSSSMLRVVVVLVGVSSSSNNPVGSGSVGSGAGSGSVGSGANGLDVGSGSVGLGVVVVVGGGGMKSIPIQVVPSLIADAWELATLRMFAVPAFKLTLGMRISYTPSPLLDEK